MLEQVSNFFYDAEHFWAVPLVLAILLEGYRYVRARAADRFGPPEVVAFETEQERVLHSEATQP